MENKGVQKEHCNAQEVGAVRIYQVAWRTGRHVLQSSSEPTLSVLHPRPSCSRPHKLDYTFSDYPNIGIFGQFDLMPDQKNNADKLSRWFSVMLVPKLLLTPIKIRIFGPKTAKFGPKSAFLVILGQILPFFAHFVQCLTKIQSEQGA